MDRRNALADNVNLSGLAIRGGAHIVTFLRAKAFIEYTKAPFAVCINDVVVSWLRHSRPGLSHRCPRPSVGCCTKRRNTRHGNGSTVIFHARIQPIGILIVNFYLIQLGSWLIELGGPGFSAIVCYVCPAIVGLNI